MSTAHTCVCTHMFTHACVCVSAFVWVSHISDVFAQMDIFTPFLPPPLHPNFSHYLSLECRSPLKGLKCTVLDKYVHYGTAGIPQVPLLRHSREQALGRSLVATLWKRPRVPHFSLFLSRNPAWPWPAPSLPTGSELRDPGPSATPKDLCTYIPHGALGCQDNKYK